MGKNTMRKYNKQELSHLKWKLIKFEGLSVKQADKRISDLIKFEKSLDKKIKKSESIKPKKTLKEKLNEDIKKLRSIK